MQRMKTESTPSLYGCAAKLKDNVADCKLRPCHQYHKHLAKQMVLMDKRLYLQSMAIPANTPRGAQTLWSDRFTVCLCYKISILKCIFLLFLKKCRLSFDCMDAGGTTLWMEEVEQCMEQRSGVPRAMHGAA